MKFKEIDHISQLQTFTIPPKLEGGLLLCLIDEQFIYVHMQPVLPRLVIEDVKLRTSYVSGDVRAVIDADDELFSDFEVMSQFILQYSRAKTTHTIEIPIHITPYNRSIVLPKKEVSQQISTFLVNSNNTEFDLTLILCKVKV